MNGSDEERAAEQKRRKVVAWSVAAAGGLIGSTLAFVLMLLITGR